MGLFGVRSTTNGAPRRRVRRLASIVSTFAIVCSALVVALVDPSRAQAGALTFDLSIIGGERQVAPNEDLAYRLTISCSGLDTPCGATVITMVLPETMDHRQTIAGAGFTGTYDALTRTVTISHPDLQDGASAEMTVGTRVASNAPPSTAITISADATIERPSPASPAELSAGPVTVTTTNVTPQWRVRVDRPSPTGSPAPGGTASYKASLCATSGVANTDLSSSTIVLTVPEGATTTTYPTGGGVVEERDGSPTVVRWDLGPVTISGLYGSSSTASERCIDRFVLVRFDAALPAGSTMVATVSGDAVAEPGAVPLELGPVTRSDLLVQPVRDLRFEKYGETSEQAGGVIDYWIRIDSSRSNVPLDDLVVVDALPNGLELDEVHSGSWPSQQVYVDVGYSVDGGTTWTTLGTADGTHNIIWRAPAGVDPSAITHLRWVFRWVIGDETYAGVRAGFPDTRIRVRARVPLDTQLTSASNCARARHDGIVQEDCEQTTIEPQVAALEVYKSISGAPHLPGKEVYLTLHVRNLDSGPLVDPVVADLLPPELEFVRWSWITTSSKSTPRVEPWLQHLNDHRGTGRTLLRFGWSSAPPAGAVRLDGSPAVPNATTIAESGEWTKVGVVARVPEGARSGRVTNRLVGLPSDRSTVCVVQHGPNDADTLDLDGDGDTTEVGCNRDQGFDVSSTAVLETRKWVRGDPDLTPVVPGSAEADPGCPDDGDGFTRYPCAARTVPGGDFEYRLEIVNVGNIALRDHIAYDVLPGPGDTGVTQVLSSTNRLSAWRPLLTGPLEPVDATTDAADLVVEYSDAADPCRPEMSASSDESGWQTSCTDDWTPAPDRWTDVRAVRVRAAPGTSAVFPAGGSFRFRVPMRAPDDAPFDSVAWSSVGSRATNADTAGRLAAAEPRKVGIVIPTPEEIPYLDLALRATVTDRRPDPLEPGRSKVTIGVEVINQGTATADEADVTVTVPDGLTYLAADNTGWTGSDGASAGGQLGRTVGPLAPGARTTVSVVLDVDSGTGGETPIVVAEISADDGDDVDSTPDAAAGDPLIDDEVDRTPADTPPDEDDHDVAPVTVDRLTYRVGDLVWLDGDADGVAEQGEPGIDGVRVELWEDADDNARWSADDELLAVTATAGGGRYAFDGLTSGAYLLVVPDDQGDAPDPTALEGTRPTAAGASADADVDHDHDGIEATLDGRDAQVTAVFSLGPRFSEPIGETVRSGVGTSAEDGALPDDRSNLTVDLGVVRTRLGDVVWLDDGAGNDTDDGELDAGEATISDLVVELWADDGNGELDPGAGDTLVATTVTDAEGRYRFTGFDPGATWFVAVPDGQVATAGDAPVDLAALASSTGTSAADEHDHGEGGPDGYVAVVGPLVVDGGSAPTGETIAGGPSAETYADARGPVAGDASSDLTADIGLAPPPQFRIGNLLWRDDDGDGRAEAGEPGIAGVRVELWEDDGDRAPSDDDTLVAATSTDAAGHYLFAGLDEGGYFVVVPDDQDEADDPAALRGLAPTTRAAGQADNRATGDAATIGEVDGRISELVTLDVGSATSRQEAARLGSATRDDDGITWRDDRSELGVDLGWVALALGDEVWFDVDGDGERQAGEPGLPGVPVWLHIVVEDPAADPPDGGGDADAPTGEGSGDEPALELIDATVTDADGRYAFDGLEPGATYVVEVPASAFAEGGPLDGLHTSPGQGGPGTDDDDDGADLDAERTDDVTSAGPVRTAGLTVAPGEAPTGERTEPIVAGVGDANAWATVDLGFTALALGDRLFADLDADGTDDDEPPLVGVPVRLLADDGEVVARTTTDGAGRYLFDGLAPGTYRVEVPASAFVTGGPLDGWRSSPGAAVHGADGDDDGIDPATSTGAVRSGAVALAYGDAPVGEAVTPAAGRLPDASVDATVDLGFFALAVGNRVFLDSAPTNGRLDAGEGGIGGVRVELWPDADGDGVADAGSAAASTETDASGYYLLDVPDAGDWVVRIPAAELAEGGPLGGYVSSDGGGAPTDPDDAVDGDDDGAGPGPVDTQAVTLRPGAAPTGEADVALGAAVNPFPDTSSNLTVDLAFLAPDGITIGDLVWADLDGSGRLDAADTAPPFAGVPVELHRDLDADGVGDDGVAHRVTTTNADGWYRFAGVPQGSWLIAVPDDAFRSGAAAGWWPTPGRTAAAGIDGDDDAGEPSDGGARTGPFTVIAGQAPTGETGPASPSVGTAPVAAVDDRADLTVDVALTRVAIGGTVWADLDGDGRRDTGEPALAGVPITVIAGAIGAAEDDVVATTRTDAAGRWHVDGLAPGDHRVVVDGGAFVPGGVLDGWTSSPDPGSGPPAADDDTTGVDDGIDPTTLAGDVETAIVTLEPATEPRGEATGVGATTDDAANDTVDLGFAPLGSLGDRAWVDLDDDGRQDDDEPGAAGVTITVLRDGDEVGRATSDADGAWTVDHLPAGDYALRVGDDDVPLGNRLVDAGAGDARVDSDVDPATGLSPPAELAWGEDRTDLDVGITPLRADLAIVKTLDGTPHPAGAVTWQIEVTNNGPDDEPGPVVVTDVIPATLRYESFTGDGWACEETLDADVHCELDAGVAAGDAAPTLRLETEVLGAVGVAAANTATVVGSATDEDLENNTSTAARTVVLGRSTLAFTGADTIRLVALAIGLLGVGTLLTVAGTGLMSRQRRRS